MRFAKTTFIKTISFICILLLSGSVGAEDRANVLYLNSYHPGYDWSDDITQGIRETLKEGSDCMLFMEYLDTKRTFGETYYDLLFRLYDERYKNIDFDLLITSDNNALDFILKYRDQPIFKDKPVVFCGVSNILDYQLPENYFGVSELDLYQQEFTSIMNVFPDRRIIYAVIDKTLTGDVFRNELRDWQEVYGNLVEIRILDEYNANNIEQVCDTLNENGVLYFMAVNVDSEGKLVDPGEVVSNLHKYASIPVYGNAIARDQKDVVGGVIAKGDVHGEACANLGIKILDGRMHTLSHKLVTPQVQFAFDYEELKRWKVNQNDLPEGSIIRNKKTFVIKDHLRIVIAVSVVFILMFVTILMLIQNVMWRKKAEEIVIRQMKEIETKNCDILKKNTDLQSLNQKLEDLNARLTSANKELSIAKIKAEDANRLKSAFLFNVSHEIRTPINSIIGFLDILADDDLEPEEREKYTHIIGSNASRLMNNVDNLLEYSRIETGQVDMVAKNFYFVSSVNRTVEKLIIELDLDESQVSVINLLKRGSDHILLDEFKFMRVVDIVLRTFIRISGRSKIQLHLVKENLRRFKLVFESMDVGINERQLQHIFMPFTTLEKKAEGRFEEVGLAMAIAKSYMTMMKGEITVASIEESGLRIELTLPCLYSKD